MRTVIALLLSGYALVGVLLGGVLLCLGGPLAKFMGGAIASARTELSDRRAFWRTKFVLSQVILGGVVVLLWPLWISELLRTSRKTGRRDKGVDAAGVLQIGDFIDVRDHLLHFWDPTYRPPLYKREVAEWTVGLSPSFRKSIADLDKKLQGRILEAIASICDDPLKPQGDTKKPLEGNRKGLWRYRIGDYRLIYRPEAKSSNIVMLDFIARGDGYSELAA